MSVTELQTGENWWRVRWQSDAIAGSRTKFRGRVITGMLTGGDAHTDIRSVALDQGKERTR
jgi:hypothetical protein